MDRTIWSRCTRRRLVMPGISGSDRDEPFDIRMERDGATAVIRVRGVFDLIYEQAFRDNLLELERDGPGRLVVDLGEVTFIDSTAIGLLVTAWRRSQRDGYEAVVVLPREGQVPRAFGIAGLESVIQTTRSDDIDADGAAGPDRS
jgi:anti-sigma B factor antagonist